MAARRSSQNRLPVAASTRGRSAARRQRNGDALADTKRWRQSIRPKLLRSAVAATESLPWSPDLLELLFEEMYVDNSLEELLGRRLRTLQRHRYPQAIAVALVLRHSWQAEDLSSTLERLEALRRTTDDN